MKDYYKILGVDKSASKDDIKKAFRKIAHEHHPDKGGGESSNQKFKEASEAYSVLGDDNKRKQYDTYGQAGAGFNPGQGGFGGQGFGGFDFSGFTQNGGVEFDLGDIFGDIFGGGGQRRTKRGRDISIDIEINFSESVFGVERDIVLTKSATCGTCNGTGGKPGLGSKTCTRCAGKGKIHETKKTFMGAFSTTRVCDECKGKGEIPKEKCNVCKGEGITEGRHEISVKIPPGVNDGEMVRLSGMGEAISDGQSGDLYVKIHVQDHPVFEKDGENILMDLHIKLSTALLGGDVPIKTLDGDIDLHIPEGVVHGEVLRVRGKGVPHERGNKRGDLLITVIIDMPKKLSKTIKKTIEELRKEGF
jgi:molecular chaperone DnaJ